jgi:hypothetical protein
MRLSAGCQRQAKRRWAVARKIRVGDGHVVGNSGGTCMIERGLVWSNFILGVSCLTLFFVSIRDTHTCSITVDTMMGVRRKAMVATAPSPTAADLSTDRLDDADDLIRGHPDDVLALLLQFYMLSGDGGIPPQKINIYILFLVQFYNHSK